MLASLGARIADLQIVSHFNCFGEYIMCFDHSK